MEQIQISRTPGSKIALGGVVIALIGLLMSLFIRPRRVWVRVTPNGSGRRPGCNHGGTGWIRDRSGNGDMPSELATVMAGLKTQDVPEEDPREDADKEDEQ